MYRAILPAIVSDETPRVDRKEDSSVRILNPGSSVDKSRIDCSTVQNLFLRPCPFWRNPVDCLEDPLTIRNASCILLYSVLSPICRKFDVYTISIFSEVPTNFTLPRRNTFLIRQRLGKDFEHFSTYNNSARTRLAFHNHVLEWSQKVSLVVMNLLSPIQQMCSTGEATRSIRFLNNLMYRTNPAGSCEKHQIYRIRAEPKMFFFRTKLFCV